MIKTRLPFCNNFAWPAQLRSALAANAVDSWFVPTRAAERLLLAEGERRGLAARLAHQPAAHVLGDLGGVEVDGLGGDGRRLPQVVGLRVLWDRPERQGADPRRRDVGRASMDAEAIMGRVLRTPRDLPTLYAQHAQDPLGPLGGFNQEASAVKGIEEMVRNAQLPQVRPRPPRAQPRDGGDGGARAGGDDCAPAGADPARRAAPGRRRRVGVWGGRSPWCSRRAGGRAARASGRRAMSTRPRWNSARVTMGGDALTAARASSTAARARLEHPARAGVVRERRRADVT